MDIVTNYSISKAPLRITHTQSFLCVYMHICFILICTIHCNSPLFKNKSCKNLNVYLIFSLEARLGCRFDCNRMCVIGQLLLRLANERTLNKIVNTLCCQNQETNFMALPTTELSVDFCSPLAQNSTVNTDTKLGPCHELLLWIPSSLHIHLVSCLQHYLQMNCA